MSRIKTGVSMEEGLARRADELARELGVTRSDLYSRALAEFMQRRENELLLENLNDVYSEERDADEEEFLRWSKRYSWERFGHEWPVREEPGSG